MTHREKNGYAIVSGLALAMPVSATYVAVRGMTDFRALPPLWEEAATARASAQRRRRNLQQALCESLRTFKTFI